MRYAVIPDGSEMGVALVSEATVYDRADVLLWAAGGETVLENELLTAEQAQYLSLLLATRPPGPEQSGPDAGGLAQHGHSLRGSGGATTPHKTRPPQAGHQKGGSMDTTNTEYLAKAEERCRIIKLITQRMTSTKDSAKVAALNDLLSDIDRGYRLTISYDGDTHRFLLPDEVSRNLSLTQAEGGSQAPHGGTP